MPDYDIPFNRPWASGGELPYLAEAVTGAKLSGDGAFTKRCQQALYELFGHEHALLTTSCTDALELSALLLDIQPGDEVILPSFAFVSTVNAFVLRGARPVFVDVDPDTLNLDVRQVEAALTDRTRAVVAVHYAGVACEMNDLAAITERRGVPIVEDNAHGLGGSYRGRPLGTFGTLATLSFHETKNFSSGEGGALLINDDSLVERAEIVREKGTDRAKFFRGQVDKYTWVDVGSSFLPSELTAAYLLAQLESRDEIQRRRAAIWERYHGELDGWARWHGVSTPWIPPDREQSFHMYYLLMPTPEARTAFIAHLGAARILAVFHYVPLHLAPMGLRFGGVPGQCPVTEDVSERLVRLPFYTGMAEDEQTRVIEAALAFRPEPWATERRPRAARYRRAGDAAGAPAVLQSQAPGTPPR